MDPDRARLIATVWRDRHAPDEREDAADALAQLRDVLGELVPDTPDIAVAQLAGQAPEVLGLHGAALFRARADLAGNVSVRRDALAGARMDVVVSEPQESAGPVRRWAITFPDGDGVAFETHGADAGPEGIAHGFARRIAAAAGWHV